LIAIHLLNIQNINADVEFRNGTQLKVYISDNESEVVKTAFGIFQGDYFRVFESDVVVSKTKPDLFIGTLGNASKAEKLAGKMEVNHLKTKREGFTFW
jgi:hypothetical protein